IDFRHRIDATLGLDEARLARGEIEVWAIEQPPGLWRFPWQREAKRDLVRANAWRAVGERLGPDSVEVASPLEPLLDLWRIGFGFAGVTEETAILAAEAVRLEG